jgi:hypothetical protein
LKNIIWCVLAAVFATSISAKAEEAEFSSALAKVPLKENCKSSYEAGAKVYQDAISSENSKLHESLNAGLPPDAKDCLFEYTMGFLEAQTQMAQVLALELMMDLKYAGIAREKISRLFEERFRRAFLDPSTVAKLISEEESLKAGLEEFEAAAFRIAVERHEALPFGRFIFSPHPKRKVRTQYDYRVNSLGEVEITEGSFMKIVNTLWSQTQSLAEEYLRWEPSMWFGEDSLVYGSFWMWWRNDPSEQSIREIKEQGYFRLLDQQVAVARSYGLPLKAFYELQKVMLAKQAAYLDRDIEIVKAVKMAYIAAPFVPLGMALGTAGLAYAGLPALSGASSFSLSSASFISAANVAAASSLLALGGFATWNFSRNYDEKNAPDTFREWADAWVPAIAQAMPLAALTPAVIGGGAASVKYLYVEFVQFISHLSTGMKYLKGIGMKESLKLLPKFPAYVLRQWVNAWWVRDAATGALKFRKGLAAYYLASTASTVIAEYVDREFIRTAPEEKFWVDGSINPKSVYRLVPSAILGLIGAPLMTNDNFFERFIFWRLLEYAGATAITFVVKREVDHNYVKFEMIYGATAGNAMGEAARVVSMLIMNSSKAPGTKFLLETLFQMLVVFPRTSVRNYFMEAYYKHESVTADTLKLLLRKEMNVDLQGYSDEEIKQAFDEYLASDSAGQLIDWIRKHGN